MECLFIINPFAGIDIFNFMVDGLAKEDRY